MRGRGFFSSRKLIPVKYETENVGKLVPMTQVHKGASTRTSGAKSMCKYTCTKMTANQRESTTINYEIFSHIPA